METDYVIFKVQINKENLSELISIYNSFLCKAHEFVCEKEKKSRPYSSTYPSIDEISFDSDQIIWRFEYNCACHCHPEMVHDTYTYSISEFIIWGKEKYDGELEIYL